MMDEALSNQTLTKRVCGANVGTKDVLISGAVQHSPGGLNSVRRPTRNKISTEMSDRQNSSKRSLEDVEEDLSMKLDQSSLADDCSARVERCLVQIKSAIRFLGPGWRVQPFGSIASGFGNQGSDLDVTCFRRSQFKACSAQSAADDLHWRLQPVLLKRRSFTVLEQIFLAKVPILKLRFEGCLDVDLSCNNCQPLKNTALLACYAKLHPAVSRLGRAVKLWAKTAGVCGAADRNMSSYAFTLMVVYFLQVDSEVKLPCLPTDAFDSDNGEQDPRVVDLQASWQCGEDALNMAGLLTRFFKFFAKDFLWGNEVVSIRLGRRCDAKSNEFELLQHRWKQRIHVEDPFEVERNLHCVLRLDNEDLLKTEIRKASRAVDMFELPVGLKPSNIDTENKAMDDQLFSLAESWLLRHNGLGLPDSCSPTTGSCSGSELQSISEANSPSDLEDDSPVSDLPSTAMKEQSGALSPACWLRGAKHGSNDDTAAACSSPESMDDEPSDSLPTLAWLGGADVGTYETPEGLNATQLSESAAIQDTALQSVNGLWSKPTVAYWAGGTFSVPPPQALIALSNSDEGEEPTHSQKTPASFWTNNRVKCRHCKLQLLRVEALLLGSKESKTKAENEASECWWKDMRSKGVQAAVQDVLAKSEKQVGAPQWQ